MKKLLFSGIILCSLVQCSDRQNSSYNTDSPGGTAQEPAPDSASRVKRGAYLVSISGCNDCHTPKIITPKGPVEDEGRMLSGHPAVIPLPPGDTAVLKNWVLFFPMLTAAKGPWGTSFSANLTSDETGIGNWTEAQFFNALRKGYFKGMEGGRMLLPPMPWQKTAKMTDEDIRSIFYYLKTVKPVKNIVPNALPPGA